MRGDGAEGPSAEAMESVERRGESKMSSGGGRVVLESGCGSAPWPSMPARSNRDRVKASHAACAVEAGTCGSPGGSGAESEATNVRYRYLSLCSHGTPGGGGFGAGADKKAVMRSSIPGSR